MYTMEMLSDRWQIRSSDKVWMFPADTVLCTTEMPSFLDLEYKYESCIFTREDSEVLDRYQTLEDAIKGHELLEAHYELKREE